MHALTLVASIGALQGSIILLSILLRFRHRKNLPLALLLTVFSLRLATIPTWNLEPLLRYPWLFPLTTPLPFLFGPLLWWYIRELVSNKLNTPKPLIVHFIPYIFETTAVAITILIMESAEYQNFLANVFSGNPPVWLPVRNGLKVLLNAAYIIFSCRYAFSNKAGDLSPAKRLWIRSLLVIPSAVLVCFTYVAVFPGATESLSEGSSLPFFILASAMVILIYVISFLFMIAPDVSFFNSRNRKSGEPQICSDEECRILIEKVERRLSEGAFHNPDLVMGDLASGLKIHPNRLSYAVNSCLGISFRTFLNGKRLDYFESRIQKGAHLKQSLLEIAFEAGFPSKSTFNRIFKERTGLTPSDFVRKFDAEAD